MSVPSYSISEKGGILHVWIRTYNFDELKEWMPFIIWSGYYEESCPMKTQFQAAASHKSEITAILTAKGYSEHDAPFLVASY